MEVVLEFLLELVLEGSEEISGNKKISRWIRYPLIALIALLYIAVISIIFLAASKVLEENGLIAIALFGLDVVLMIGTIIKFKKIYHKR